MQWRSDECEQLLGLRQAQRQQEAWRLAQAAECGHDARTGSQEDSEPRLRRNGQRQVQGASHARQQRLLAADIAARRVASSYGVTGSLSKLVAIASMRVFPCP